MRKFPISTALTIALLGALLLLLRLRMPGAIDSPQSLLEAIVAFTPKSTPASPLVERPKPEAPQVRAGQSATAAGTSAENAFRGPLLDDRDGDLDHF
jgi:hypothetical protein